MKKVPIKLRTYLEPEMLAAFLLFGASALDVKEQEEGVNDCERVPRFHHRSGKSIKSK